MKKSSPSMDSNWDVMNGDLRRARFKICASTVFPSEFIASNEFNILSGKSEDGSKINILLSRYVDENATQPDSFSEFTDIVNLTLDGLNDSCTYTWQHWGMVQNNSIPWQLINEGSINNSTFELSNFEMNQRSFHFIQLNSTSPC